MPRNNENRTDAQIETDYAKFVAELTKISNKYGVAIASIGGVEFLLKNEKVAYDCDHTSGDLLKTVTEK